MRRHGTVVCIRVVCLPVDVQSPGNRVRISTLRLLRRVWQRTATLSTEDLESLNNGVSIDPWTSFSVH